MKSSIEDIIKALNVSLDKSKGLNLQGEEKEDRSENFILRLRGA